MRGRIWNIGCPALSLEFGLQQLYLQHHGVERISYLMRDAGGEPAEVLAVAVRIACTAAVSDAGIETSVRAEDERSAIVVREGRVHLRLENKLGIGVPRLGSAVTP